MYKKGIYRIERNERLTETVWRMTLAGDTQWITAPGQFVNIALTGKYLRRPISVCDWDEGRITLIYKVVGEGTEQMSRLTPGAELDLLTGLGNGFSTKNDARRPLLVGGGVGVPPLYGLARQLLAAGKPVEVVLGFNTAAEIFYEEEFRALGCRVTVATVDGSRGIEGFVTTAIAGRSAFVAHTNRTFTCNGWLPPTRSSSPYSITRNNFSCTIIGAVASSSRNSVPPSARSNLPG